jgi:hypothetical protein
VQGVHSVADAFEYVPMGHFEQVADPREENVPWKQDLQSADVVEPVWLLNVPPEQEPGHVAVRKVGVGVEDFSECLQFLRIERDAHVVQKTDYRAQRRKGCSVSGLASSEKTLACICRTTMLQCYFESILRRRKYN